MKLTWVLASVLFVGVGYAFVQRAPRPRFVVWSLLCAALFALATRDLFRPRGNGPPASNATDATTPLSDRRETDERRRTPLFARLRRRVGAWLD
jgi:hypothetical protein